MKNKKSLALAAAVLLVALFAGLMSRRPPVAEAIAAKASQQEIVLAVSGPSAVTVKSYLHGPDPSALLRPGQVVRLTGTADQVVPGPMVPSPNPLGVPSRSSLHRLIRVEGAAFIVVAPLYKREADALSQSWRVKFLHQPTGYPFMQRGWQPHA